ncbi:hypothetical protein Tco_0937448 [Tanacetum coccineum]|uniref:Transposase n=1 Tax=Tanacetum coccineum TaxID=301880 RepID=A0ABQ5DF82_9ASTR
MEHGTMHRWKAEFKRLGSVEGSYDSEGDDVILDGEDEGVGEVSACSKNLELRIEVIPSRTSNLIGLLKEHSVIVLGLAINDSRDCYLPICGQ